MKSKNDIAEAARRAIKAADGRARLADALSEHYGVERKKMLWRVDKWFYNGVPPEYVPVVSKISGIPNHELRPDIFGDVA